MAFATSPATLANMNHLTPRPVKGLFGDNYLSLADMTWTQQFLPEVYEKEVERYGNRTIGGFLRMVGAEMPMASDQVVWSEQGRLHIAYDGVLSNSAGTVISVASTAAKPSLIGPGMTLVINLGYVTVKAFVVSAGTLAANLQPYTIKCYDTADGALPAALRGATAGAATSLNIFVYGSEYGKGSVNAGNSIDASFTTYSNKPIILRDKYSVNGSDVAQIGWVEVTTEMGTGGYLWYLKSEHESRLRFEDYLEMSMVEAENNGAAGVVDLGAGTVGAAEAGPGSEGLFAAIEARGNVYNDFAGAAAPGAGALGDFDTILKQLDTQGAIEENMLFLSRATALDFDDMIAAQAGGGYAGTQAASYGLFDNEAEMAMNFGFSGFRRGSYDFYKTDWKYLNDFSTRGLIGDIDGVMIPAGTSTVYDQSLGSNIRRPFLHVRYRASEADDRRMKSWVTGSVGGAYTSELDAMTVNFLSERCLVTQAANNFVLFKSTI